MEYRNARLGEVPRVREFFESYFGKGFFEVEAGQFQWMHRDNPWRARVAAEDEVAALSVFNGDEVVAGLLYYPVDFYVDGRPYPSCITTGTLVKPGYPGLAGLLLRRHFLRTPYHLNMGDTQVTRDLLTNVFGFSHQHNIGRAVMVGAEDAAVGLLARRGGVTSEEREAVSRGVRATAGAAGQGGFVRIERAADLAEGYWERHLRVCRATVSRDRAFMKWRYFDHPHLRYDVVSDAPGQDAGIAVLRVETERGGGARVVRMLDFLPTEGGERHLASAVSRYLLESRAAFLDFFCGARRFLDALPEPFMLEQSGLPRAFPRLFQPLEWRERYSLNATFGRVRGGAVPEVSLDEVYFTKADACQDVHVNDGYATRGF